MSTKQVSSIKANFAYKSLLTISTYIMGFITFPYVSRIFGAEKLGLVSFVDNTISYFLLFATMGISNIGVREIASVRNDQEKLNRTFSNLLGVNLLFTLATLAVYLSFVNFVPHMKQNVDMFYVGVAKILFSSLLLEWLFSGMENFRYITTRSVFIKVLYVIAVFVFIRRPDQYKLYFYFSIIVVVLNGIINFIYSRKYIRINFRELFNFKYFKSNIKLGIYNIMTSMYLTFNVMYLGLVCDNTQVGYYSAAFKMYSVILGLFTAFTSIMLPRMSSILAEGDRSHFCAMINKSYKGVSTLSIPLVLCSVIMAPQIIRVICGSGYEAAVLPMRIIMPAILFVGIAQILAIQALMPMRKDNVLLSASIVGAIISVVVNILFVDSLGAVGSAMVLICAEGIVTMIYMFYTARKDIIHLPYMELVRVLLKTLPLVAVCLLCCIYISDDFISLSVAVVISLVVWVLLNINFIKSLR